MVGDRITHTFGGYAMPAIGIFEAIKTAHGLIIEKFHLVSAIMLLLVGLLAVFFTVTDFGWLGRSTSTMPNILAGAFLAFFWHRSVLLDSQPDGDPFKSGFFWRYIGLVAIFFVLFMIGVFAVLSESATGYVMAAVSFFLSAYIPMRLICVLPAKAIGADETLGSVWRDSGKIVWKLMLATGLVLLLFIVITFPITLVLFTFFESNDAGVFQNPIVTILSNLLLATLNVYSGLWVVGIISIFYQRTFLAGIDPKNLPQPAET